MMKAQPSRFNAVLKIIFGVVLALIVAAVVYVGYFFLSYNRLTDKLDIEIDRVSTVQASPSNEFSVVTYNIGMGIYSDDFGFFMDGGNNGRADSKEKVLENINGQISILKTIKADFIMLEETAIDCTCSYSVNQYRMLRDAFDVFDSAFAQNWDSPYIFYPISNPFGSANAGLAFLSKYSIDSAIRTSLPVEDTIMKYVDLDRCYSCNRVSLNNGKELIMYVIHPSAYTSDGYTADEQIRILMDDAAAEYAKGNYVIMGGDWNRDLEGDSDIYFGPSKEGIEWTRNFDRSALPLGFSIVSSLDSSNPIPTGRNADGPYDPNTQVQIIIDGFIVSDNVAVSSAQVIDTGFKYSDHNPVKMIFTLK